MCVRVCVYGFFLLFLTFLEILVCVCVRVCVYGFYIPTSFPPRKTAAAASSFSSAGGGAGAATAAAGRHFPLLAYVTFDAGQLEKMVGKASQVHAQQARQRDSVPFLIKMR